MGKSLNRYYVKAEVRERDSHEVHQESSQLYASGYTRATRQFKNKLNAKGYPDNRIFIKKILVLEKIL